MASAAYICWYFSRLRSASASVAAQALASRSGSPPLTRFAVWVSSQECTIDTGRATYWSRSRRQHWVKGETSGHHQYVKAVSLDSALFSSRENTAIVRFNEAMTRDQIEMQRFVML